MESRTPHRAKPSSRHAIETAWRVHVEPEWAARGVVGISESEIAAQVAEIIASRKSARSIRRIVFVMSGVLAIAVRERAQPTNPLRASRYRRRDGCRRGTSITSTWRRPLGRLATARSSSSSWRTRDCGGGGGDSSARPPHEHASRRIPIEEKAVTIKGAYEIGTPKSGLARLVPVPPHLVQELARQCEGKGTDSAVLGKGAAPLPHAHATSGWFAKAVIGAQVEYPTFPRITPHDLRHTATALAVSADANVKAAKRMLGHASAAMTLDDHAGLFDDDLEAVSVAMSDARVAAVG